MISKDRFGNISKTDQSVIAPIENDSTASKAYAVGEHFMRDGAFCTCKQAISQGEGFTLNTNYTVDKVSERIADLEGKTYHYTSSSPSTITVTLSNKWQQLLVSSSNNINNHNLYMVSHITNTSIDVATIVNVGSSAALTFTNTGEFTFTISISKYVQVNIMSAEKFTVS